MNNLKTAGSVFNRTTNMCLNRQMEMEVVALGIWKVICQSHFPSHHLDISPTRH